ncbi:CBASS cGAMP-activated phospholipase [Rathayibacter sp. VKM Ac-2805]|uniref:CBASS cGAMP-activated phospholipase n=1 Tax=Rathayibacter sp. VKM Ac-2805 TaxID=2609258 RepID=UPI00131FD253|nr:CBASS cGAMP-activated phospholipase [Rathayibacter sp. VKM Ac-2805]QHC75262.1 patatin [Rathayibacter sp. VKM Ac-2805]
MVSSDEPEAVPGRFQVLAMDGGGAKALFTAHVLARLEDDLKVSIRDSFDLIAGTSAGGIIALALGAGVPPAEIVEDYSRLVRSVFPPRRQRLMGLPRRAFSAGYSQTALRDALLEVFGDRNLGDSDKRLVIPTWNSQRGGVYLFKTRHHPELRRDWKLPMVDVALATSAAPSFFPAARVDSQRFIDGGVWANNPSVVAIAEAVKTLAVPLGDIRLLNIGTTEASAVSSDHLDDAGLIGWAPRVVDLVLAASSRGGQAVAQNLLGKQRYHRFDAVVPRGKFVLDRVDAVGIAGVAADASRVLAPIYEKYFKSHKSPPFSPFVD